MREIKKIKVKVTSLTILLITVFLIATLSGTQLINEASAIDYTEYTGTLDGADWALRIPDPWNGMLVMVCRGYNPSGIPNPVSSITNAIASVTLDKGFAVAASNYGATGLCIAEGVNSTYQLTMHIIDNYNATGRVFLLGISMGGAVVLLLGEKYPEIYSGVLDVSGIKDAADLYTLSKRWSNLTDEELTAELTALNITRIPPDIFSTLEALRSFMETASNDTEHAMGGTPETQPQAYQDISPTYHANITIPVITVHGTDDGMVPYYQSLMYQTAVAAAGCSDMYRLATVLGGGHAGLFGGSDEAKIRFDELVEWSNYLTGVYDWPMFGHDPQRTGYTESPGPDTNQTLWTSTISVGGGTVPAIADDKLYIGSWNGIFYCFDATNGSELWIYSTGNMIYSDSAVDNGRVYFGSQNNKTYCLNATTGALIWNFTTGAAAWTSPVVANGRVYMSSADDNVYCLDAANGTQIWNYTTGGDVRFTSFADNKVYAISNDGKVYCLDAGNGAQLWNYTTGAFMLFSAPTIAEGKVYVGSYDKNVYCLNVTTGTQIWNYTTGASVYSSPAVAYGKVYVGSHDDEVYCLNTTTGDKIWNYTTLGNVYGAPAVADGRVYVGSQDNVVYCLGADDGALVWKYVITGSSDVIYDGVSVANGVVYVVSGNTVYAIGEEYLIPESLTIVTVLLLSTAVAVVSFSLLIKRPKWKKYQR